MSTISTSLFLWAMVKGKYCLHSSQSSFLNLITTCPLWILIVRLVSNQPFKHFKWIEEIVPMQLHGEISGLKAPLSSTSSVPQHILHYAWVVPEAFDLKELALTNFKSWPADLVSAIDDDFLLTKEDCWEGSSKGFSNWSLFVEGFKRWELTTSISTSLWSTEPTSCVALLCWF